MNEPPPAELAEDRQLDVRLYGVKVGTLRGAPGNGLVFQYDDSYIQSPHALPLSTRSPLDNKPWTPTLTRRWFDGLLPEGARRYHLARLLRIVHVDTWSLLEIAGSECAGAVQIVPPGYESAPRLFNLDEDTLEHLLEPATAPIAEDERAARLSLAGAQDKVVLFRTGSGPWQLPVDGHPGSHVLKPAHPDFPQLVRNEHWCMEVARRAGIETATTTVERIGNAGVLVIERYDRSLRDDGTLERIHQEDLAQALGSRTKYQDEGFPNTYDLANVPGVDPETLFERIIVNWLLGNCDAHAKNYSILEPGTRRARLSPAYDIVSTAAYKHLSQTMGTSIGNARTLSTVTRNAVEHMGSKLGVEAPAERAFDVSQRVLRAIEECRDERIDPGPVDTGEILERIHKVSLWNHPTHTSAIGKLSTPSDATRLAQAEDRAGSPPPSAKRRNTGPER